MHHIAHDVDAVAPLLEGGFSFRSLGLEVAPGLLDDVGEGARLSLEPWGAAYSRTCS